MAKNKEGGKLKAKGQGTKKKAPPAFTDSSESEVEVIEDSDVDEEFVAGTQSSGSDDTEGNDSQSLKIKGKGKKKGAVALAANRGARWSEAEWISLLKEAIKHRIIMQQWQNNSNKDEKKSALGDISREYFHFLTILKYRRENMFPCQEHYMKAPI